MEGSFRTKSEDHHTAMLRSTGLEVKGTGALAPADLAAELEQLFERVTLEPPRLVTLDQNRILLRRVPAVAADGLLAALAPRSDVAW
jgi:hypothetical protein